LEEKEDSKLVERLYPYKHIVATFFGCEANLLDRDNFLKASLFAINKANMALADVPKNPLVYKVDEDIMGGGVSVNALITTSHLTVHSAKDYSSVEFDCATCGPESRPEEAFRVFEEFLKPRKVKIWFRKGISSL
jgi:S-adenosylmethionine/arginine decarboxylase-like enzyme